MYIYIRIYIYLFIYFGNKENIIYVLHSFIVYKIKKRFNLEFYYVRLLYFSPLKVINFQITGTTKEKKCIGSI